ncbi:MAG: glycosyltransferase family protein, partial [Promethearchaeota archaeon]
KDEGVFTINWSGDMRIGTPDWYFKTNADLTLFSNTSDIDNLRARGLKADFLQIGIDPKVYNKHESDIEGSDIVYMGNNYRNQFPEGQNRINMIQFLHNKYGNRFMLLGNGWPFSSGENNADQLRQSKIYNNSKIGINFSQFNTDRYTSDRLFRILASGCMCLSHHYKGIEKDFKVGVHLDTFKDLDELQTKINYYLYNPNKRKEIAFNGYRHCHENYTYKSMVENLIKLYKQYK